MIAVIDYDTGNLRSVENALRRLGGEFVVTDDAAAIRAASHVLLPGVGEASSAMARLRERGLAELIPSLAQPVLGICIGMQLMCRRSEEGGAECLGIFGADVLKLSPAPGIKVPHMGWDTVGWENLPTDVSARISGSRDRSQGFRERARTGFPPSPLFAGLDSGAYLYYVHSYAPALCSDTAAVTQYGVPFSAALQRGNFFGTQFHPEKSGATGERILKNFLGL